MRALRIVALVALAALIAGCGGVLKKQYEYEEDLYLALDGSATLYVNASVPALVALRGVDLDVDPASRLDRQRVRAMFTGPGVDVRNVSLSRRDGRRFVHVRVDADRLSDLPRLAPFAWSSYELKRGEQTFEFRQLVGAAAGKPVGDVGWTGRELVAFRMHLPSRIPYHNAPSRQVQRGNILEWEQPLAERLKGAPLDIQATMATESILYTTLLLFGAMIVAAAAALGMVVWWIARKGRDPAVAAGSHS
jgi:hypothetical protein